MLYDNEFGVYLSFISIRYGCQGLLVITQNKLFQLHINYQLEALIIIYS